MVLQEVSEIRRATSMQCLYLQNVMST